MKPAANYEAGDGLGFQPTGNDTDCTTIAANQAIQTVGCDHVAASCEGIIERNREDSSHANAQCQPQPTGQHASRHPGKPMNSLHKRQRGYMLIGMMFAIALAAGALTMYARYQDRKIQIVRAEIEGQQAGNFAIGLRGLIATTQANPALLPAGVMNGVDWLKSPGCGGLATNPPEGYVPCSYTGGTFGDLYRTRFTRDIPTNAIEARTSFIVPTYGNSPANRILMAERVAQAALSSSSLPNNGMFFTAFANTPAAANGPLPAGTNPGANAGRVVMLANNAPSNDIWLRTDGTNQMLANLNMGGLSIGNALDARFTGDVRVDRRVQVRDGLTVTNGPTDLRGGVVTNEVALTSIGKYVTEGIYDARVYSGSTQYMIAKQDCSQAGGNPGIYAAMQSTGTPNVAGYSGDALYESRVDVTDLGASWRVRPVVRTSRFNLAVDGTDLVLEKRLATRTPIDMRILIMRRCR